MDSDKIPPSKMVGNRPLKEYFFRPAEELYDLVSDPHEVQNLAKDADHSRILEELRAKLETWQYRTEDPWMYRDGVSVLFVRHHLDTGMVLPDRRDFDADTTDSHGHGLLAYQQQAWGTDTVLR